ncbi:AraC family transcriptional regulator [Lacrimispora sp. 38-1]|uniref:helix-turn-helix transcriptional regulator n=1 Tax=Lacrimispora sp. 38-1 TaxID=3125778 RepID=UPI003CF7AA66
METLEYGIFYEKNFKIGSLENETVNFYFFDYDDRHASINMDFQHTHPYFEIFILLDKKAVHFIEGRPFQLQFGDIVLIRPERLHKTEYPAGRDYKRLVINFNYLYKEEEFQPYYEQILSVFHQEVPVFRFDQIEREKLFWPLNSLFLSVHNQEDALDLAAFYKLFDFLRTLYVSRDGNIYVNQIELTKAEKKIYNAAAYIHSHFQDNVTLTGVAGHFNIHPCYLSHKFKEINGFTVHDYITMTRLSNARHLLAGEEQSITEIAFSCGFKSISQFNRSFQKFVQTTPSDYRKKHRLLKPPV